MYNSPTHMNMMSPTPSSGAVQRNDRASFSSLPVWVTESSTVPEHWIGLVRAGRSEKTPRVLLLLKARA